MHLGASTGDGTLVCKEYHEETKDTGKSSVESASDGTLEALKHGIHDGRKITGEGTMVLQDYVLSVRQRKCWCGNTRGVEERYPPWV